ncbi:MucBP domain-containing protein [Paenibacillus sp. S-12]|uniref:MucBP domain-containing protein n=1 Tax=Paenibacillus sp. S-12 TaxID=3031371 RepID=UPI0025A1F964|nr:MucBP domain-containing protein [Paenibacillus sp. S-12]
MKRRVKLAVTWLCVFAVFFGFIPHTLQSADAAAQDPIWPESGAVKLSKTAKPTGTPGEWKITLTAEGKNVEAGDTDVVLVLDKSDSMRSYKRLDNAKKAAEKFVNTLLFSNVKTRIALVTFSTSSEDTSSGFLGQNDKQQLLNNIKGISASGGTNIQSALYTAHRLLATKSSAKNKFIVLLSDGAPTFSSPAKKAASYSWPNNKYNFVLSDFDYTKTIGSGNSYQLSSGLFGDRYTIGNYTVKDNGIPTISQAKASKDAGINIYSIGLEVGNDANAVYVLKNSASANNYYPSDSAELEKVFSELAGKISYAAENAVVKDPMGEMFNLIFKGNAPVENQDYKVSQGTVKWDAASETFVWDVGNIVEGSPATLTYTIKMDSSKNPSADVNYPTNGRTTIEYTDVNQQRTSKEFEVPQVSFGKGSILVKGYKVNDQGEPINADGKVVERVDLAEQLYSGSFTVNGKDALDIGPKYKVPAPKLDNYVLKKGTDPTEETLTIQEPNKTIWFGYALAPQKLTIKYVDRETGKSIANDDSSLSGTIGQTITLKALDIPGYTPEKTEVQYTFKAKDNEYTFFYKKTDLPITIKFVDKDTSKSIADDDTSRSGKVGEAVTLKALDIPGYTPEKAEITYTVKATDNVVTFFYKANAQKVNIHYIDQDTKLPIAKDSSKDGKTGESVTLTALEITGYTPVNPEVRYTFTAEANQENTFFYTKNAPVERTVHVHYKEADTGAVLKESTSTSGKVGETVTLKAEDITINGVVYVPNTYEHEYTITDKEEQSYTFIHTKKNVIPQERTVHVHYKDAATGTVLKESTSTSGKVGATITLRAEDITVDGVIYVPASYQHEYAVTEQAEQSYTFFYSKKELPTYFVTVHHLEEGTDAVLHEPTTVSGKSGEVVHVTAEPISVADAVYQPIKFNHDITIEGTPEQLYTIYYKKGEPVEPLLLTVLHLDKETLAPLAEPTSLKGKAGEHITLKPTPITVTDAVYNPEHAAYDYVFTGEATQTFSILYIKNPITHPDQHVTIKYVEQGTGKQLVNPTTKNGKAGEKVELTALSISGYTPVKSTDTYTFTDKEGQEYIFYYTRNSSGGGSSSGGSSSYYPSSKPLPQVPPVQPLPPVPKLETSYHYNYINGYPDGKIKPENLISREEVAVIFYRLMENSTRANFLKGTNSYKDIAEKRWSNRHISTMENAGIIKGYPDGSFLPERPITRAEFAAIASRFDKLNEQPNTMFSDISGHWAEKYIVSAANKGWIKGYKNGTFKPNQYITRAEAMAFINSVLNRKVHNDEIHKDAKKWPDITPTNWYYSDVMEATNYHDYHRIKDNFESWDKVNADVVYP